jgi:hypothetical protein
MYIHRSGMAANVTRMVTIPEDEIRALRDAWTDHEKVDWAAYDRLRARVIRLHLPAEDEKK